MSGLTTRFRGPEHSAGLMLWHLTNAWQRSVRAALAPHELTHVQFVLLATLTSMHPAQVTQRQLADAAATDAMMTSQVLRALERRGLIERSPHPNDGRAVLLSPTREGVAVVNEANTSVEDADEAFFNRLGTDDLDSFLTMLRTLNGK
jgi:DNA-binding MarR family transcriptional regulator